MKAQFLACGTRNAKHKGEQLQLVAVEAKGLVRDESSALIGSPPCGSSYVFERADTVNKYALNKRSFIRLRTKCARTKQALAQNTQIYFPLVIQRSNIVAT